MTLLDYYLPDYQFAERHYLDIPATAEEVMAAVLDHRPENDPFFRRMIALRELPMRTLNLLHRRSPAPVAPFSLNNFVMLEQRNGCELAFGLIGKFWRLNYGQVNFSDGNAFRHFSDSGVARLVLGFSTQTLSEKRTRLFTETRVFCPERATVLKFAPYWYLIRPVSGLIRRRILASISHNAQKQ